MYSTFARGDANLGHWEMFESGHQFGGVSVGCSGPRRAGQDHTGLFSCGSSLAGRAEGGCGHKCAIYDSECGGGDRSVAFTPRTSIDLGRVWEDRTGPTPGLSREGPPRQDSLITCCETPPKQIASRRPRKRVVTRELVGRPHGTTRDSVDRGCVRRCGRGGMNHPGKLSAAFPLVVLPANAAAAKNSDAAANKKMRK